MDETSNNTPDVIDRNELVGANIYYNQQKQLNLYILDFNVQPTGADFPGIKTKRIRIFIIENKQNNNMAVLDPK